MAFFILLTVLSREEESRKNAAMTSVDATFARALTPPEFDRPETIQAADPDYFEQLARLLADVLNPGAIIRGPSRDTLSVIAPTTLLFPAGRATVRPDRQNFLTALAVLAQQAPSGTQRAATLYLGAGRTDGTDVQTARLRVGELGRGFSRAGYPGKALTIGLTPRNSDTMILIFQTRPVT